jgi:hypothetical protein
MLDGSDLSKAVIGALDYTLSVSPPALTGNVGWGRSDGVGSGSVSLDLWLVEVPPVAIAVVAIRQGSGRLS